ncbi:histidinol-phosphate aminotransferase family protein [Sphingomonas cannabina]|uniref:pyridoxal phosphate-dependent aminotransferase n=1 Tax=Sphingomonas cannabina TaxID=2899123 RepID=UPI001F2F1869|nr:histidinol-phosphate transaminase [Sphingomonas cannabina]UIJ46622.1 histidinol-phosphate aminotransferase family protein [Sphingomonas cannabina]
MDMPLLNRREWLAMSAAVLTAAPAAARPAGGERIRLSLNENAYGPSPQVAPAIARATTGIERYVDQAEVDTLARQIATLEGVAPEQVVVGEVLAPLGAYLARQRQGGGIVYSAPGYTELVDSAAPLGGVAVPVPLDDRLENDLPALARAIGARTLAVSLVNPHNPSGAVGDAAALHRFIADAAARTLVVVDEAYLEYDDFAARSAVRHVREGRNVLVFRTLAKIYGLAGLPIGYALAPASLADGLRKTGIGAPHSLSRPALAAAAAALADQRHVASVRAAVVSERQRLTAILDERGLRHSDSRANFVFFAPPDPQRYRTAFTAAGIEIARAFPPLDGWIRITIGQRSENDRVAAVLRQMPA